MAKGDVLQEKANQEMMEEELQKQKEEADQIESENKRFRGWWLNQAGNFASSLVFFFFFFFFFVLAT